MNRHIGSVALCVFALAVADCGTNGETPTSGDAGASSGGPRSDAGGGGRDGSTSSGSGGDATFTDAASSSGSSGGSSGASGSSSGTGSSSGDGGSSGAGDSSSNGDATFLCTAFGGTCTSGAQCCSGLCDTTKGTCASSIATCSPQAAPCTANTDCCTGACVSGQCGATQCLSIGATCPVAGNACCTGNCNGTTCQPIATNPSCTTANNTCTSNTECCSGLCASGRCALGSSYCIQSNDVCYHANDCCGGICTAPNGQPVTGSNPGLCSQPSSGSVNCSAVDGTVCPGGGCGACCSRLCAPYGPSGVNICQPAQGCRVEGDLCRSNSDCCGGMGSGVLGDGSVVCSNSMNGGAIGVCMTPGPTAEGGTCVPEGDVCHYNQSNYTCSISSARADCCGPQTPKWLACVLDPFGVPRCNAYTGVNDGGVGCIAAGHSCAMASECCGGLPCVPNGSGQLVCGSTACQQSGNSCTVNADCCSGLPCIALPGSTQGTCTPVTPPPPPPPSDGGTPADAGAPPDAGISPDGGYTCALYGQSCTSLPCCTGTQCISGKCSSF
jgi:hypothetical protein